MTSAVPVEVQVLEGPSEGAIAQMTGLEKATQGVLGQYFKDKCELINEDEG